MGWKIERSGFRVWKEQWPDWPWDPPNLPFNWALVALSWGVKWHEEAEV